MRFFIHIIIIFFISGCGFKSDPEYLKQRQSYRQDCHGLYMAQRSTYSSDNEGSTAQIYTIETDKNKNGDIYNLHHSFLSNNNYVNRITTAKNIRTRSCDDGYLRDIRIFDGQ